jgi:hypothetical protein
VACEVKLIPVFGCGVSELRGVNQSDFESLGCYGEGLARRVRVVVMDVIGTG